MIGEAGFVAVGRGGEHLPVHHAASLVDTAIGRQSPLPLPGFDVRQIGDMTQISTIQFFVRW